MEALVPEVMIKLMDEVKQASSNAMLDRYIIAFRNNKLLSLDGNGNILWERKLQDDVAYIGNSISGREILIGYSSGKIAYLDDDGNVKWEKNIGDDIVSLKMCSSGKYIAVGTKDRKVYFLNSKGEIIWKNKVAGIPYDIRTSSSANYLASSAGSKGLYFFDNYATNMGGKVIWRYDAKEKVKYIQMSSDGFYVSAATNSKIFLLDRFGKLYWTYKLDDIPADMKITPSGDYIVIGVKGEAYPGQVCLLNKTKILVWRYIIGESGVKKIATDLNASFIVAATEKNEIMIFHRDKKLIQKKDFDDEIEDIIMAEDGSKMCVVFRNFLRIFDMRMLASRYKVKAEGAIDISFNLIKPSVPASEKEVEEDVKIEDKEPETHPTLIGTVVGTGIGITLVILMLSIYSLLFESTSFQLNSILFISMLIVFILLVALMKKYVVNQ